MIGQLLYIHYHHIELLLTNLNQQLYIMIIGNSKMSFSHV